MNLRYRMFVIVFFAFQVLTIFKLLPSRWPLTSYYSEVFTQVIFTVSKMNHLYNFFTDPQKVGGYGYVSNHIYMLKKEGDSIIKKDVSSQGSIKKMVSPVNYARINNLQVLAVKDTLLYSAVVRSQALFFMRKYQYPLMYVEVMNHECKANRTQTRLTKSEKVEKVYTNYLTLN